MVSFILTTQLDNEIGLTLSMVWSFFLFCFPTSVRFGRPSEYELRERKQKV